MAEYGARVIATDLGFVEGPVVLDDGRVLILDMSSGWGKVIDPQAGAIEDIAYFGGGPNGAAIAPDGSLMVCNNGGFAWTRTAEGYHFPCLDGTPPSDPRVPGIYKVGLGGSPVPFCTSCNGYPLKAPNDLVFDDVGGFYFTDSGHASGRDVDLGGLYYVSAEGVISELIHEAAPALPLTQPNGVALSPDGKSLYVSETATARLWKWPIASPGVLGQFRESQSPNGGVCLFGAGGFQLFDSMAVDAEGYICVGTLRSGGITVIAPDGQLEAFVTLPDFDPFVTNICFGGKDMRTAFVTAAGTGTVWAIDWPRPGLCLNRAAM